MIRRSTRTTKGKHFRKSFFEYLEEEKVSEDLLFKKSKQIEGVDDDLKQEKVINGKNTDEVRCTPCGMTNETYDENNEEGSVYIQCDLCNAWQHAECMGFKNKKNIPIEYQCNECKTEKIKKKKTDSSSNDLKKEKILKSSSVNNLKLKNNSAIAEAFLNFFQKTISIEYNLPEEECNRLAQNWSFEIDKIIQKAFDKSQYNSESRRILFLIKKYHLTRQIYDGDLTFDKLVKMPPEEINTSIKDAQIQVKTDIKNIVLVNNDQNQRIKRTHKGEELIENLNTQPEDFDLTIDTKNVVHRAFETENFSHLTSKPTINNINNLSFYKDDDDDLAQQENFQNQNLENKKINDTDTNENTTSTVDTEDDDLDFIITGKHKNDRNDFSEVLLPHVLYKNIWKGIIIFPDFVSFSASASFFSCNNYEDCSSTQTVNDHNKYISICNNILNSDSYEIEGRLDKNKAESYLNEVTSSKKIFLLEIKSENSQYNYKKIFDYLNQNNKVGVLSKKPDFVKDSYIMVINFSAPTLPLYLKKQKKKDGIGMFALYVLKKNYIPNFKNTYTNNICSLFGK